MMDNLTKQIEEIEALSAIYDKEWQTEDEENRVYSIKIKDKSNYVNLYFKLPSDYPLSSPPSYEISAPHLNNSKKKHLKSLLDEAYLSNIGQSILFQWIEVVREEIQSTSCNEEQKDDCLLDSDINNEIEEQEVPKSTINSTECELSISHGEVILDRKSSFQGHVASVVTTNQVHQVLDKLLENRKIAHATHNIYAYRIYQESTNSFVQDCEDDGEAQAGGRLLHLLQILDVKNVIVVVTRWYGGIHLGPDRFRHINNAARQVLLAENLIPDNKSHKK